MQLSILREPQQLQNLADEWNALLKKSASHVPFLRAEYQIAWWNSLGGGEWSSAELYTIAGRKNDGGLAGIAPFFITQTDLSKATMMLLGSHEISDYLDIIASPEDTAPFIEEVFDHLTGCEAPAWQALDFYNVLETSPTLPALEKAARRRGWSFATFSRDNKQCCPAITIPGNWEVYLSGIDKKQRHEIRRKLRRAEESEIPVGWYIVQEKDSLTDETEEFFRLMALDGEKRAFLTEAMRKQFHTIIKAAYENGWLQLAFLEVGGEKAAAYLNFDYDDRIWVYNSGIDNNFGAYSPGWVLLSYLLQWANEHDKKSFDFMRGDEDYKYRFGGVNRYLIRALIER